MNNDSTYVIAEVGVNHNGDLDLALRSIEEACKIGVDCVKFQTFKAKQIVTRESPKAAYQLEVTSKSESQFDMLKKLELGYDDYIKILNRCKELKVDFLSTPYNKEDVDFLVSLGVDAFKIASGQLTETPFIKYAAQQGKRMILSTGMATMSEVFDAVQAVRACGNEDIVVLQCTTNYPSLIEDANLNAMLAIKEACKVQIGYSDHVQNNYACYAAVALGARVIEKHFTLDTSLPGPDHSSSLNPADFGQLVNGIREIEKSLGHGIKTPSPSESRNIFGMKRSLVFIKDLTKGSVIDESCIGFKRPSNGLEPKMLDKILGKKVTQDVKLDEPVQYASISW